MMMLSINWKRKTETDRQADSDLQDWIAHLNSVLLQLISLQEVWSYKMPLNIVQQCTIDIVHCTVDRGKAACLPWGWQRDEAAGTDLTALARGLCSILGTRRNCWGPLWWEASVVTTVIVAAAEIVVTVSLLWSRPHSKCSVFSSHNNCMSQELLTPLYRENWPWRMWVIF